MRIVMTRREALDTPDGINIFLFTLAEALLEAGHEVIVVSSAWTDSKKVRQFYPLRRWPDLVPLGAHTSVNYLRSLGAWMAKGKRVIEALKPDLVILNGAVPLRLRATTCTVSHDAEKRMQRLPYFRTWFKRYCYGKSDIIVATCDEVRNALSQDLSIEPARIRVIPTCVRLASYTNKPFAQRENAILHMGTVDYKNPMATLRAFAQTGVADARLYITGKPTPELTQELAALPAEVRKRVELPGYVSAAALIELLGSVKVVSAPSSYVAPVASPTAIEALASGTPVVSSTSISRQVLADGVTGFIRESSDVAAMAAAFRTLLADDGLWKKFSANALEAAQAFSAERVAGLYLQMQPSAVSGQRPAAVSALRSASG